MIMPGENKKLLFLTLITIKSLDDRGIYTDLLRKFHEEGFDITIISPIERRYQENNCVKIINGVRYINVKTLNIQKTNIIEKGLATILIEYQFLKMLKKYTKDIKFDIILYSTPPITIVKPIKYIKERDDALSYLLLKDIFPQNAVDMGILKKNSLIYKFFRRKEKYLYNISNYIGCMSNANSKYLVTHNKYLNKDFIEVNPNSISPKVFLNKYSHRKNLNNKYSIPEKSLIFLYGGNLGLPQGLDFFMKVLEINMHDENMFFLIIGSGTESNIIKKFIEKKEIKNALYLSNFSKNEYDLIIESCDIGLIFLSNKFTIPNFPSRMLSYLENKMPIIAATDITTDIGEIIVNSGAGISLISGDIVAMQSALNKYVNDRELVISHGENAHQLLMKNYLVNTTYNLINNKFINV